MSTLTEQEIVRYSRHIILPEVGGRGQKKLKEAAVLLAGLGAAGSAAALYLAAAGIGRLTLWDPGLVTPQDLAAGIAHATDRVGLPRARSAAVPVRAINPDAQVEVLDRESDVAGSLPEHHILLAAAGDWDELTVAVRKGGGAAVFYGIHGATGAAMTFRLGTTCPACLGQERSRALGLFPEGGSGAAVPAAAGVIGVMAATEAVKLILGVGSPLFDRVLCYDGWAARFREERAGRLSDCPVCKG